MMLRCPTVGCWSKRNQRRPEVTKKPGWPHGFRNSFEIGSFLRPFGFFPSCSSKWHINAMHRSPKVQLLLPPLLIFQGCQQQATGRGQHHASRLQISVAHTQDRGEPWRWVGAYIKRLGEDLSSGWTHCVTGDLWWARPKNLNTSSIFFVNTSGSRI